MAEEEEEQEVTTPEVQEEVDPAWEQGAGEEAKEPEKAPEPPARDPRQVYDGFKLLNQGVHVECVKCFKQYLAPFPDKCC